MAKLIMEEEAVLTDELKDYGTRIVELFGHRRIAGHVREVMMFGQKFAQIEVPALPEEDIDSNRFFPAVPARVEVKHPNAIYGMITATPDEVKEEIRNSQPREWRQQDDETASEDPVF